MQRFVASIFFEELRVERPIYGGDFKFPAVPREKPPALLLIRDHVQIETLPFSAGGHKIPRVIAGEHIADDIVLHVATMGLGMSVDCGPGVWVVRDTVPEIAPDGSIAVANGQPVMRPANEQDKQHMFDQDLTYAIVRQQRYGEYLIAEGDKAEADKKRGLVTKRMKAACLYYNRERSWLAELKDGDLRLCPWCVQSIDARAIKCPNCGEVVDMAKYVALLAQRKKAEQEVLSSSK